MSVLVFDTAIGPVGVAWGARGLIAVQLPEGTREATERRLVRRLSGRAPEVPADSGAQENPALDRLVASLRALVAGECVDLAAVDLDLAGVSDFDRGVYALARTIPCGETSTYGAVAQRLGRPGAAREVGQALGRNPFPLVVPCHRVVAAGGKLGGFSAAQGAVTKRRLLEIEGALPVLLPLF